jgi:hypothetical protein
MEGKREIAIAIKGGYEMETLLFYRNLLEAEADNYLATLI